MASKAKSKRNNSHECPRTQNCTKTNKRDESYVTTLEYYTKTTAVQLENYCSSLDPYPTTDDKELAPKHAPA